MRRRGTWSATPAGATLTPSGLHASFGGSKAGTYTITATSVDGRSRTASTTVLIVDTCGTPNGVSLEHMTNISADETWAGDLAEVGVAGTGVRRS